MMRLPQHLRNVFEHRPLSALLSVIGYYVNSQVIYYHCFRLLFTEKGLPARNPVAGEPSTFAKLLRHQTTLSRGENAQS
jgi:hypothetical protein